MNVFRNFGKSVRFLFRDKVSLIYSLVPIAIGIFAYSLLGTYLLGDLSTMLSSYAKSFLPSDLWGGVLSTVVTMLLGVLVFFLVNFTFVMTVAIIAAPFNDLICGRVEKHILGQPQASLSSSWAQGVKRFFSTFLNEIKKVILILILAILAFIMGLFPLLTPVSFVLTSLLVAANFLDYTWSRKELPAAKCMKTLFATPIHNILGGALFAFFLSIPVVNLICLPLGVVFFSFHLYPRLREQ